MSTIKRTLSYYLKANLALRGLFFSSIFLWTGGFILQRLLVPLVVAGAFNTLIQEVNPAWSMFTTDLIAFLCMVIIAQIAIDTALILEGRMEAKVMIRLYSRIFDTLSRQSLHFHNNSFSGSLVTQANRFVNGYIVTTDTFVLNFTQLTVMSVLSSAILFWFSPVLGSVVFTWVVVFVLINIKLSKRRIALSKARALADTKLTGYLADSVSNIAAMKAYAAEKHEHIQFMKRAKHKSQATYRYWVRSISNDAVYGVMMGSLQLAVLITSILLVKSKSIMPGVLILSQVYVTQIIATMWGLSGIIKNVEQNLSDASEMTEILDAPVTVLDKPDATTLKVDRAAISFRGVDFKHQENDSMLFEKLSLRIQSGEHIGLVGKSGGGKTTITKLLLRFLDIQDGTIEIDDQDISQITQESLRKNIAYVPQEPLLFHRSLAENISYGKPDADQSEIEKVAKLAHAHEFIKDLAHNYDTLVGERGIKLSGGQRQRIAIARAMLKDAPILVLDEATSALDSESEVLIQDALWKLMEGRTAIVIAHRLSTIQKMDRIIVMDDGKIVEEGTHKELIAQKGVYASLWDHQTGGFIEE